jgi:hypothetical protein
VNGNGHRPQETVWQPHGGRARKGLIRLYFFAGAIIGVIVLGAIFYAVFGHSGVGGSWVTVATLSDARHNDVSFDARIHVFVVASGSGLVAFSDADPVSADSVYYCPSSGWFETPSGRSKFDHHGFYREGPAQGGLARVAVREEHGFVTVNPTQRLPGAPRSVSDGGDPAGRYCSEGGYTVDKVAGRWQKLPDQVIEPASG